ncbi:MAG: helix-turn-helix domain-containing protein [Chloroflexota bacterium]|jgi:DNA-binding transcriptional MocR family regulator|nr:helix-turn-helix domain-containing protein [Chloroflexota bacterium]
MDDPTRGTIFIEDETLRQGFTQIPNALLQRTDLTPGAKLAYMALLSFAWQEDSCFPGQERLAKAIGMSKRSIDRYIKELETANLVSHVQRGLNQTNLYTLHRFDTAGIAKVATPELPTLQDKNRQSGNLKNTQLKDSVKGYRHNKNEPYDEHREMEKFRKYAEGVGADFGQPHDEPAT